MILRVFLLLVVAVVAGLPFLAHASPPDPTWIGGLWDDADSDNVIALITSFNGARPTTTPRVPAPTIHPSTTPRVPALTIQLARVVHAIVADAPLAERLPAFLRRGPPIA